MDLLFFIILLLLSTNESFENNIDVHNSVNYQSLDITSLFGYSVKIYSDSISPPSLLIGAPRSEGSPFVPRTGNVFSCSVSNSSFCIPLNFTKLNAPNERRQDTAEVGEYIAERKDNMWLGVSIETNLNGHIITCGHRYVNTGNGDNLYMHGQCHFLSGLNSSSDILQPCKSCNLYAYYQCLAGLGLNIDSDGLAPLIGTPGAKQFTGEVFYGRNFESCSSQFSPENFDPNENGEDALFGFSITRGRLINRNYEDIISSMPRYNYLYGGIAIFRNESGLISNTLIISGEHFGAYFGHSLITSDIDGDGIDEIIVGLPNYSSNLLSEVGLVQIFFYSSVLSGFTNITLHHPDPIDFARFGYSLANLGDINKVGGAEFAIGAPFGSHSGIVYIFTWSSIHSFPILYQKVDSNSLSSVRNISSFGSSISPGLDVDGNNYEDILIGAPQSSNAILMHTFPVIYLDSLFSFNTEHIYTRNSDTCDISLNGIGLEPVCFQLIFSLSFFGKSTPKNANVSLDILLDKILFQRSYRFRVYFVRENEKVNILRIPNFIIGQGEPKIIISELVYVESNPIDLFTPVEFHASVFESNLNNSSDYFKDVKILGDTSFSKTLEIRNVNCGADNICESDLVITGNISFSQDRLRTVDYQYFIVNEVKHVVLNFSISNKKEEALSPIFSLHLPPALYFNRILDQEFRIHNETTFLNDSSLILIDLAPSLVRDEFIFITIILSSSKSAYQFDNIIIRFSVKSINYENPSLLFDNSGVFIVPVKRSAILQLQAFLQTDQVYYNKSNPFDISSIHSSTLQSIGNEVTHSYSLNNLKSSDVSRIRINFHWPLGNISSNMFLLYLVSLQYDSTSAVVRCDEKYFNYLNLSSHDHPINAKESIRSTNTYRLFKRDTSPLSNYIDCDSHPDYYVVFSCHVFNLSASQGIKFTVKSRVFEPTLIALSPIPVDWQISTKVSMDIVEAGIDFISTIPVNKKIFLVTYISPQDISLTYFVLQWYHIIPIILSVSIPFVLFIVIFIALYVCGFFKIKKRGRIDMHTATDEEFEEETTNLNVISNPD
ncbi:Integrin alpha [Oopsacas minuta]|uniref:Integrin alpha n=1 Tax=Oopsacas minuta TaxID=111878 RepID=A0AAV7JDN4_9METZ|nr:Integrin alpha [Oopsacas minuta]